MPTIGKVPRDPRPVYSGLGVVIASIDRGLPPLGSAGWRQTLPGVDSYMRAEPPRPRVMATDVGSSAPVAAPESRPKKSAASAIWPNLP
jgi:hypothetical protein